MPLQPLQPIRPWNGVAVGQEMRDDDVALIFKVLQNNPEKRFESVVCGDMLVLGVRNGNTITISDCIIRRRTRFNADGSYADPDDVEAAKTTEEKA